MKKYLLRLNFTLLFFWFIQTNCYSQYELWSWGYSPYGISSQFNSLVFEDKVKVKIKEISIPNGNFAIDVNNKLWVLGINKYCSIDSVNSNFSCLISSDSDWKSVTGNYYSSLFLKENGTLWSIGTNDKGQLGLPDVKTALIPIQIGKDSDWVYIYAGIDNSLAIKKDGSLWGWGTFKFPIFNGKDNIFDSKIPKRIGNDNNWKTVVSAYKYWDVGNVYGLKTNNTLWYWKELDSEYQLFQLTSDSDWVKLACGDEHYLAIKKDASIWGWGSNNSRQLGLDSQAYYDDYKPKKLMKEFNFKVKDIGCATYISYVLSENGDIYYAGLTPNNNFMFHFTKIDSPVSGFSKISGSGAGVIALRDLTTEVDYQPLSKGTNLIKSFQQNNSTGNISLVIDSQTNQKATIRIIDILGNELLTISNKNLIVGDNQININIQNLYSGFYILNITTDYQSQIVKFIR